MKIIIHIDEEGQTIDAAVHDVFVESADVVRIRRENEKLSTVIDKIRVAMRKRGSVVAIQAVNQTIYEHDHIEERGDLNVS